MYVYLKYDVQFIIHWTNCGMSEPPSKIIYCLININLRTGSNMLLRFSILNISLVNRCVPIVILFRRLNRLTALIGQNVLVFRCCHSHLHNLYMYRMRSLCVVVGGHFASMCSVCSARVSPFDILTQIFHKIILRYFVCS